MSYAFHVNGRSGIGYLSGVNDKVDDDEIVTFRFQPRAGVNGPKGDQWARAMAEALERTGHYETAEYKGWGSGINGGKLVVRLETKSGAYTLQQLANFTHKIAERVSRELNMPVVLLSAVHDSDEAFAQTTDPHLVPPGGGSTSGGGQSLVAAVTSNKALMGVAALAAVYGVVQFFRFRA